MNPPGHDMQESQTDLPALPAVQGRVIVAMSGGVDSSYVAARMAAEGHDVVGIAMRLYGTGERIGKSCCSPDDLRDAREVAAEAGFPFYVANYEEAFRERVMAYFVEEYRRGRTPSPCVLCNDHLKFDILLQRMEALDGQLLITGHYAIVDQDESGRWRLRRGVDARKDQSYFLFGLQRSSLPKIRFPLGELTKTQVLERAVALGVPTARKPESQDICFVSSGSYASFVEARLAPEDLRPGDLRRWGTGAVLGQHEGIHRFTPGQRRGLGVSAGEPLFVHSIDAETGTVWLASRDEIAFRSVRLLRCNWLAWGTPPERFEAHAQVRYRHAPVPAQVQVDPARPEEAQILLHEAVEAVAPGQALVLYRGDEVLGGGWIEDVQ